MSCIVALLLASVYGNLANDRRWIVSISGPIPISRSASSRRRDIVIHGNRRHIRYKWRHVPTKDVSYNRGSAVTTHIYHTVHRAGRFGNDER